MKSKKLSQKIRSLRIRNGFSQEELAEKTGLSLRTIQRIENAETEARGDSLKRLAAAFDISPDEITDWTVREDPGFLMSLNLSALCFIVFPLLGVIVPLIIWLSKKDKIRHANEIAKELLNFEITWALSLFSGWIISVLYFAFSMRSLHGITMTPSLFANNMSSLFAVLLIFHLVMYVYNLTIVLINFSRIKSERKVYYQPCIRFIK